MGKDTVVLRKKQMPEPGLNECLLDTKAQLGTSTKKSLKSRAKKKYLSSKISGALANLKGSDLHKSYWGSQYCNSRLYAENGRVTSQYCNARWCITCNRIRMAKLIVGYVTPLKNLEKKYFVTLTVPNCSNSELFGVIRNMLHCCKSIMETMKKRKQRGASMYQLIGIRKMECTYNSDRNDYHPHFHFIISGEDAANDLVNEWVSRNPLCTRKAQDVRVANDDSVVELFKYFAKIVGKNKKGELGIYIKPLNVIFCAMKGLRVFQPFGVIKDVTEDVEGIISENLDIEDGAWDWYETDWCNEDGECLSGYIPDKDTQNILESIVT
jgi:hypothetical protein